MISPLRPTAAPTAGNSERPWRFQALARSLTASRARGGSSGVCQRDDDLSLGVSRFEATHGVGRLVQRVDLVDDRGELFGRDELGETLEVGVALSGGEHGEPLADEW